MCVVSPEYRQLYDLASDPVEFVWRKYVGRTSIEIAECIREMLAEEGVEPSQFKIIFMSMYNDINGWQSKNVNVCRQNAIRVASFAEDFEPGRWSCLGPGKTRKWVRKFDRKNHSVMVLTSGEYDARIRQDRALLCSGAHLSIGKSRAQQQGRWTNIDPTQRRPKFRRNIVENRRMSQPALSTEQSRFGTLANVVKAISTLHKTW